MTFEEFVEARLAALLRFAVVLTGERGLAEDVVQEVLLRAHQRWRRIGALDAPEHYVRRMIVNEYLSWRRRWSRIIPQANVPEPRTVADHADLHSEREALRTELDKLRRRQRAVLRRTHRLRDRGGPRLLMPTEDDLRATLLALEHETPTRPARSPAWTACAAAEPGAVAPWSN